MLISNYIKILSLPIINQLEKNSEKINLTFINHNKSTKLLYISLIHKQDIPPVIIQNIKRIEIPESLNN